MSNSLWPCGPQASLCMGFSRKECWSGWPCLSSGVFPGPGIEPASLMSVSCIGRQVLKHSVQFSHSVWLFATPWTAAHQASLLITNSWSLPKLMSIESVIPSSHLIVCHTLLLLPSIFPSIRVFSNSQFFASGVQSIGVSASTSSSLLPSNEYSGLI